MQTKREFPGHCHRMRFPAPTRGRPGEKDLVPARTPSTGDQVVDTGRHRTGTGSPEHRPERGLSHPGSPVAERLGYLVSQIGIDLAPVFADARGHVRFEARPIAGVTND